MAPVPSSHHPSSCACLEFSAETTLTLRLRGHPFRSRTLRPLLWAAAAALGLPLSLHTATRRQGRIRGAGDKTLRDASSRATKAFYPALSMCDLIFSGVFERHPRLTLAIVRVRAGVGCQTGAFSRRTRAKRLEKGRCHRWGPPPSGSHQTPRWREPDSNHRFRLRCSPSGSSFLVSADLSTLPSRKRSSQRTQR